MPENNPLPGWYQDPSGFGEGRYWDGAFWSNSVSRSGVTIDVPIEPERAALPPVPGSEMTTPDPVAAGSSVTKRSPLGAIVGVIGAVLIVVLVVVLINNGSDSSDDETPPGTNPPATEAPAAPDTTG
jgi:hypothetical protein